MMGSGLKGRSLVAGIGSRPRLLAVVAAISIWAFTCAPPAAASKAHVLSYTFAGEKSNRLSNPSSVAVDDSAGSSAGDIYVTDPANRRVEKFTSTGEFLFMIGKEVNETEVKQPGSSEAQQDLCTAESDDICKEGTQSSEPGGFSSPNFLAVDMAAGESEGDLYVGDTSDDIVSKFDSSGDLVSTWMDSGQYHDPGSIAGEAVDQSGDLFVSAENGRVDELNEFGGLITTFYSPFGSNPVGLALDTAGRLYNANFSGQIVKFTTSEASLGKPDAREDAAGLAIEPSTNDLYVVQSGEGGFVNHFAFDCGSAKESCSPIDEFGAGELSSPRGIALSASSGAAFVANTGGGDVAVFAPVTVPTVSPAISPKIGRTSATVSGTIELDGGGPVTRCEFEYVDQASFETSGYGGALSSPCVAPTPYNETTSASGEISGLQPATKYHFRLVATDGSGAGRGEDRTFTTAAPVIGLTTGPASEITPSTATLSGSYTGDGTDTHVYFEYGTTESYGLKTSPVDQGAGENRQEASAAIEGLDFTLNPIYHFRIVAINGLGMSIGQDRTFHAAEAPAIRSVTATNLGAKTADLEATINPNGVATSYHFEYGVSATYGSSAPVPAEDIGSDQADQISRIHIENLEPHVTYHYRVVAESALGTVASADQTFNFYPPNCPNAAVRQQTKTAFLPDCRGYELVSAAQANGTLLTTNAPNSPYADNTFAYGGTGGEIPGTGDPENALFEDTYVATRTDTGWISKYVGIPGDEAAAGSTTLTDRSMDRFLAFDPLEEFTQPPNLRPAVASEAPYVYDAEGNLLGQWPTDLGVIPNSKEFNGSIQPSPDFSHLAFSSNNIAFAPNGLVSAPGSAYDFNTVTNEVSVISTTPGGTPIRQQPASEDPNEAIAFPSEFGNRHGTNWYPSVSTDGSHILMSTQGPDGGVELFMRVNDAITYVVSRDEMSGGEPVDVNYLGMTESGSKVFFTTADQLVAEDTDHSVDLYMWSEATDSLTLVSKGPGGGSDACEPVQEWTSGCGVVPVRGATRADNSLAGESGDIYFYSPEQLDGQKGVLNQQNLYFYQGGQVHYVATFSPGEACSSLGFETECGNGPVERIQVSPSGGAMAFVTNQQVTPYNNDGFEEMYIFSPTVGSIVCASCNPSGEPPTSDVTASENGLFMSNDGRAFFYTGEALVPQDTDNIHDVYEYVAGRPQLITTGTGSVDSAIQNGSSSDSTTFRFAGLIGVSADGINVYFSSYETLVPQDENGNFLKFYDARTDGGFFDTPAPLPCEAADECHGTGSSPPSSIPTGTSAPLGEGGNARVAHARHDKKRFRRRNHHRRRGHDLRSRG